MAVKISKIPLPRNYDPKMNARIAHIGRQKLGEDYEFAYVDEENAMAVFSRKIEVSKVRSGAQRGKEVDLTAAQRSPSAGDRVAGYYQAQESFQGLTMTQFDPHRGTATFMPLTEDEVVTRAAIAEVLGVKPWDVEVKADPHGGYQLTRIPGKYTPSKHDERLTEAAETKVPGGKVGWFVSINGKTLTGRIVPAELPTFPDLIPYPMKHLTGDPNRTPFGMKLAKPGAKNEIAEIDWLETTSLMLGGLPSSGKRQPLDTPIPVPVSDKFPSGWATIGTLDPGDKVYQRHGRIAPIASKSRPIKRPTYKLTFADGQTSLSDEDHLWIAAPFEALQTRHIHKERGHKRTEQIVATLAQHTEDMSNRTAHDLARTLGVGRNQIERVREALGINKTKARLNTGLVSRTLIELLDADKRLQFLDEARHSEAVGTVKQIARALRATDQEVASAVNARKIHPYETLFLVSDVAEALNRSGTPIDSELLGKPGDLGEISQIANRFGVSDARTQEACTQFDLEPVRAIYSCGSVASALFEEYRNTHRTLPVFRVVTTKEIVESYKAGHTWVIPLAGAIEGEGGSEDIAEEQARRVVAGGIFDVKVMRAETYVRLHALKTVADLVSACINCGEYTLRLSRDASVRSVVELARSLGMLALQSKRAPLTAEIVTSENLLGPGKRSSLPDTSRWNSIRRVEYVGETTGCCISVDDPTHTYLTGEYLVTHNTVTINGIIFGKLANHGQVVIIDTPDKSVDFLWMKEYVWPGGWGCGGLRASVASLKLVYEEGQRRAKTIAESNGEWQNWQDMPASERFSELTVIADEYSALSVSDPVPKELPKEHPMRIEVEEDNLAKAMVRSYTNKIIKEMRFVGIHMMVSSQVTNQQTGIPPSMKNAIGGRLLQGVRPSPAAKSQAFNDPKQVPDVPSNIASEVGPARGTGSAELTGQDPYVYKSFYASPKDYRSQLEKLGIMKTVQQKGSPNTTTPEPRSVDIDRIIPSSLRDDSFSTPPSRLETEGGFGEHQGKDKPLRGAAAAAHQLAMEEALHRENQRRSQES